MTRTDSVLYTATTVPFDSSGAVDAGGLTEFYRWLDAAGVDGVFPCGTTGEFVALDDDERTLVVARAVEVFGHERVIAHIGAPTLRQALSLMERAKEVGASRFSAITPYFERAHDAALLWYYANLGQACGGQLYAYHFPARTGVDLTPARLGEIVAQAPVMGIKVSGLTAAEVLKYRPTPGFQTFTGNDASYAESVRGGAFGAVSGLSSAFPEAFVAMREALASGDEAAMSRGQADIDDIVRVLQGGNFTLVKKAMDLRGVPAGPVRVALDAPTDEQVTQLRDLIARVTQ